MQSWGKPSDAVLLVVAVHPFAPLGWYALNAPTRRFSLPDEGGRRLCDLRWHIINTDKILVNMRVGSKAITV